jgi:arsenite methyltransferase
MNVNDDRIRASVRERYADIAKSKSGCGCSSTCCPTSVGSDASTRLGYSEEDLAAVPHGSNMGLGCGNPQAIAGMKQGEVVLDLGSGSGFDCFLAMRQVGPTGRVIGVDMTPDMVSKARSAAEHDKCENVEFRLGEIEHIPVADNSIDVIISNCVINLSPDKSQVFRDAYRVLKLGGRIAVSDVVATREIPKAIKHDMDKHAGCVSGAALVSEIETMLLDAGFSGITIETKEGSREFIKDWFPGSGIEEYVVSANIIALKPTAGKVTKRESKTLATKTKELIALGASIAGHCQPCLSYHVNKAKELGIDEQEIKDAITVGHMVEKGAMSAMRKFAEAAWDAPVDDVPLCCADDSSQCEDGKSKGKGCCA